MWLGRAHVASKATVHRTGSLIKTPKECRLWALLLLELACFADGTMHDAGAAGSPLWHRMHWQWRIVGFAVRILSGITLGVDGLIWGVWYGVWLVTLLVLWQQWLLLVVVLWVIMMVLLRCMRMEG